MHKRFYRLEDQPDKMWGNKSYKTVSTGSLGGMKYVSKEAKIYTTDYHADTQDCGRVRPSSSFIALIVRVRVVVGTLALVYYSIEYK